MMTMTARIDYTVTYAVAHRLPSKTSYKAALVVQQISTWQVV